jgi:hypothetical protein
VRLVDSPHGERPFRTIVDRMGLGDHVAPHNELLETMMTAIYPTFGIPELQHTKTSLAVTGP